MRDVTYTTLSGNNLSNMAEDAHSRAWSINGAQNALNSSKKTNSVSRREEFQDAASAHLNAAMDHENNWQSATNNMPSTGGFTATPKQNSTAEMYRNN